MSTDARSAARTPSARALVRIALTVATFLAHPCAAGATTRQVGCTGLQQAIDAASAEPDHGQSTTIVLEGMCPAGVTLPAGSDVSIEGEQGTSSGFDGTGSNGPLLATEGVAGAVSIANLTFEHAAVTGASAVSIAAARVALTHDSFLENEARGESAHAALVRVGPSSCPPAGATAIALSDSTFAANTLALGGGAEGGAGALLEDACEGSTSAIEGNSFLGNVLTSEGAAQEEEVVGAGLLFVGDARAPTQVTQRANVFDSNRLATAAPGVGDYGGAGEWLTDASLLSTRDRFSRNTLAGTESPSTAGWSWGAGLGAYDCPAGTPGQSTLEDDVVVGNSIGSGTPGDLGGGGVWTGCMTLRTLDSTVVENTAPNGSGIEGEPSDTLDLANSIVAENPGGYEIAGFYASGGSIQASHDDACASATPGQALPGAAVICAAPLLSDAGNPASVEVWESEASPTIDAGANSLVPEGLALDYYGDPRVLARGFGGGACGTSTSSQAIVDMGASESVPIAVTSVACPPPAPPGGAGNGGGGPARIRARPAGWTFAAPRASLGAGGEIVLRLKGLAAGRLSAQAVYEVSSSVERRRHGHGRRVTRTEELPYGEAVAETRSGESLLLAIRPTRRARAALARRMRLRVRVGVAFAPESAAGADAGTGRIERTGLSLVVRRRRR